MEALMGPGTRLGGRYRIIAPVGEGGFGTVIGHAMSGDGGSRWP